MPTAPGATRPGDRQPATRPEPATVALVVTSIGPRCGRPLVLLGAPDADLLDRDAVLSAAHHTGQSV